MKTSYYSYHFSNGDIKFLTPQEAEQYEVDKNTQIIYNGFLDLIKKVSSSRPIKIWREQYSPGLGRYISTHTEYKNLLKERGLIEAGTEKPVHQSTIDKSYFTDDKIKEVIDSGAELSGNEISALKSGEKLFKE